MVYIQKKKDILWGGATASSQYEGGYDLDGKGLDTQDCRPYLKRTSDATTATRLLTRDVIDEAKKCQGIGNYPFRKGSDGYHHIDEDIALLKELGTHERDAVPVGFVHVGLDLKDKGGELIAAGVHGLIGQAVHAGQRGGGQPQEVFQERLHAEVGQRRTEEDGAQLAFQHLVEVKFLGSAVQQLDLVHQLLVQVGGQQLVQCGIAQLSLGLFDLLDAVGAAVAGESKHFAGVAVEHALELLAAADGPVHGVGLDAQDLLDVLHQLKGVASFAVHLIDEGEDGDVTQGADLEQLDGLGLNALCRIDDHDSGVRCHQGTVGILREVLMSRCVQDIDTVSVIIKLQYGRSNRDTSFFLNLHPVRNRMFCSCLSFYTSRLIDRSSVEKELLCQCRLTCIGM